VVFYPGVFPLYKKLQLLGAWWSLFFGPFNDKHGSFVNIYRVLSAKYDELPDDWLKTGYEQLKK
jgi:hypothetical protein